MFDQKAIFTNFRHETRIATSVTTRVECVFPIQGGASIIKNNSEKPSVVAVHTWFKNVEMKEHLILQKQLDKKRHAD